MSQNSGPSGPGAVFLDRWSAAVSTTTDDDNDSVTPLALCHGHPSHGHPSHDFQVQFLNEHLVRLLGQPFMDCMHCQAGCSTRRKVLQCLVQSHRKVLQTCVDGGLVLCALRYRALQLGRPRHDRLLFR